jgi:hypothetical protein
MTFLIPAANHPQVNAFLAVLVLRFAHFENLHTLTR